MFRIAPDPPLHGETLPLPPRKTAVWVLNGTGTVAGSDLQDMAERTTEAGPDTGVPRVVLREYVKGIRLLLKRLGRQIWEDENDLFFGVFSGCRVYRTLMPLNGYFPRPVTLQKVTGVLADVWHFFGLPPVQDSASNAQ